LDTAAVTSFYGDKQVRGANVLLLGLYTAFFSSFGNLVGLLMALRSNRSVALHSPEEHI
jgi:hypothetical protein